MYKEVGTWKGEGALGLSHVRFEEKCDDSLRKSPIHQPRRILITFEKAKEERGPAFFVKEELDVVKTKIYTHSSSDIQESMIPRIMCSRAGDHHLEKHFVVVSALILSIRYSDIRRQARGSDRAGQILKCRGSDWLTFGLYNRLHQ